MRSVELGGGTEPAPPEGPLADAPPQEETQLELILPARYRAEMAGARPGDPISRRTPFYIGLTGALGVAVAYLLVKAVADVSGVLLLIGVALFLAIGLNPAICWLEDHGLRRGAAVAMIVGAFLLTVGGFVAAAVPPITRELHDLTVNLPRYKLDLEQGKGWLGHLVVRFHLTGEVKKITASPGKLAVGGGLLGAGKIILSVAAAIVTVVVLTIYFLIALPSVRRLWLNLVPSSRRPRVELLTDEVFGRVGGFVLGNLLTSLVTGAGTTLWLLAMGVPYPLLLGLFVAIVDLVPLVGSTFGGLVVSLVALVKGLPIAIATACFYIAYRLFEDYLLTPRVMLHTVRISAGTTIVATLLGGALLGLVGALVAIPVAATIHLLLEDVLFPRLDKG